MSTWLKNNLIKSWFLRRVGHWFMAWKVKWRAPGLRRKFGHKFTHIFYFHRGKVAKFLKEELYLRCPEPIFFLSPSPRYICQSYPRKHFVCVSSVSSFDSGALDRAGLFLFDQMDFAVFQTYCGWRGMAMHEQEIERYGFRGTPRNNKCTLW